MNNKKLLHLTKDRIQIILLVLFIELIVLSFSAIYHNALFLQAINTFTFFALPAIIYSLVKEHPSNSLSLSACPSPRQWLILLIFIIAIYPATNMLTWLNELLPFPTSMSDLEGTLRTEHIAAKERSEAMMRIDSIVGLFSNLFVMAIVAAICEELFFRGFLQNWLSKKINIHLAIVIVSVVFSIMHFDFYGFIPRMAISIFYGYMLYFTTSLWITIVAHFVNNALYVSFIYLQYNYNILHGIEDWGSSPLYTIPVGIIGFGIAIFATHHIKSPRVARDSNCY